MSTNPRISVVKDTLNFKSLQGKILKATSFCLQIARRWVIGITQNLTSKSFNLCRLSSVAQLRHGWPVGRLFLRLKSIQSAEHTHITTKTSPALKRITLMMLIGSFVLLSACGPQNLNVKPGVTVVKQKPHTHQYYWRSK